jgi:hypothetical protein
MGFSLPEFKEFVAHRIPVRDSRAMSQSELALFKHADIRQRMQDDVRAMITEIDTYVLGMPLERIEVHRKYPRDWWQAFKERWFPAWAIRRWPVAYEHIDVDEQRYGRICPHLDAPQDKHLMFLAGTGMENCDDA